MSPLAAKILELDRLYPADPPGSAEEEFSMLGLDWADLVAMAEAESRPAKYRVAIVACSKSKLTGTHPAKDLYTGELFKLARQLAEKADRWIILSALHGVVDPEHFISSYDLSIEDAGDAWDRVVAKDLAVDLQDIAPEQVLCLAPESYVGLLPTGFSKGWARPLKGKAIGEQKKEIKRLLGGAQ